MRHRCVYYKVPRDRLAPVCAAVRAAQQACLARHPGLQAQLLLRTDTGAAEGPATLMEVWLWPAAPGEAGGPAPPWGEVESELAGALADALIGVRHVEDFGPVPS